MKLIHLGYLITSIIASEIADGRFSFGHFYERRARRLFPALFVVLAASTIAAACIMFPPELKTYGKVLAAALAFSANMLFARLHCRARQGLCGGTEP